MASQFRNNEYTIGWICALSSEMAAAEAMLDVVHGTPLDRSRTDTNNYRLGQIKDHKVVLACLPAGSHGVTSAARVAEQLLSSFESIKFGVMVGIGGGVPSNSADIRLGDVVVSCPTHTFGGVVQYDSGKATNAGKFVRTGSLNKPPQVLLSALSAICTKHELEDEKLAQNILSALQRHPKLSREYIHQGAEHDHLFEAAYNHAGSSAQSCESCDPRRLVARHPRPSRRPLVHYGTVASGNQVIKDGITRDQLSQSLDGVLCFEMEAAGLMDSFPCLVIRGISDYADSHKNNRWQKYAALTAAAYAKEFLHYVPRADVLKSDSAPKILAAASPTPLPPQPLILSHHTVESPRLLHRKLVERGTIGGTVAEPDANGVNIVHQRPSTHVREVYMPMPVGGGTIGGTTARSNANGADMVHQGPSTQVRGVSQMPVAVPYQMAPPMAYSPQGRSKHKPSANFPKGAHMAQQKSGRNRELDAGLPRQLGSRTDRASQPYQAQYFEPRMEPPDVVSGGSPNWAGSSTSQTWDGYDHGT
jgi:nucleoside phosphorylase